MSPRRGPGPHIPAPADRTGRTRQRRRRPPLPRLHRIHRLVAGAGWTVLVGGLITNQIAEQASYQTGQAILLGTMAAFFPLLVLRTIVAARAYPDRRVPILMIGLSVMVWALGSFVVNAESLEAKQEFPSIAEWIFLASYLGIAGFLITDPGRNHAGPRRGWLDVAVICGAAACLASLLLVTPLKLASGEDGLPLLLALVYPLADLLLGLVVLGQALLRMRTNVRQTAVLGVAFFLMACADSSFALQVSTPTYHFGNASIALWGAAWVLLISAACRPQPRVLRPATRGADTRLLVGAGAVALAVLTIRPDETLAFYTVPPAVLTMAAVGARMTLALRDAKQAATAVALSKTDDLTKLPNRRAVRSRLVAALNRRTPLALMLLDLDGFKDINDALGHHAGDTVLQFVALRMQDSLGSDVMVARLGGDEFAILLEMTDEAELVELAHRLLRDLAEPVLVDGIEISPSGSIGITVVQESDLRGDSGEVLRRADVAMYQAKSSRSGAAIYDGHLDDFSRTRLEVAEDLRRALADDQVEVWYQPQVDVATGTVYGVEALVRWRHPTQGVLSPAAFLPTARRVGLMGRLSDVIAWQAVRDLKQFLNRGHDLRMAINCAPPELLSQTFLPRLYAALEEWDVPADRLLLEVTEESFLSDPQRARDILLDVRSRGIRIAIDDYGTGFSSLTHLRNLPVEELKIDRSLVHELSVDGRSRMIVASTIQLAHALDMRAVAEGVESAADVASLTDLGIDSLQGYYVSRPMPAADLTAWLGSWTGLYVAPDDEQERI